MPPLDHHPEISFSYGQDTEYGQLMDNFYSGNRHLVETRDSRGIMLMLFIPPDMKDKDIALDYALREGLDIDQGHSRLFQTVSEYKRYKNGTDDIPRPQTETITKPTEARKQNKISRFIRGLMK